MRRVRQPGTLRTLSRRAILCLLLGAILQYLVAAGFALDTSPTGPMRLLAATVYEGERKLNFEVSHTHSRGKDILALVFSVTDESGLVDLDYDAWPDWDEAEWHEVIVGSSAGMPTSHLRVSPPSWMRSEKARPRPIVDAGRRPMLAVGLDVGCGWPWRSASYFARWPWPKTKQEFDVEDGLVVENVPESMTSAPRVIPLNILWSGATANTLVYAAVLFVPFTLIPLTRRHLRRRAGRCIVCGYDLRGAAHPVCPECGAAITPRATT